DALGGEPVEVRRAHVRVAGRRQALGPELVECDEEDVGVVRRHAPMLPPHRPSGTCPDGARRSAVPDDTANWRQSGRLRVRYSTTCVFATVSVISAGG